jgi:hypothetical protein
MTDGGECCGLALGFSRPTFCACCAWSPRNPGGDCDIADTHLTNDALEVRADRSGAGYRFVADNLIRGRTHVSEGRVWRLCSPGRDLAGTQQATRHSERPERPAHDDLVQRDFTASAPNRLWSGAVAANEGRPS